MKPLVVVNPQANGGRAGRTFAAIHPIIERRLGPVDVAFTTGPGDAVARARAEVDAGRTLLIAAGGDGTLHEVANGVLAARGDAAIGYVGLGTGGDFRRTLGIEHRLDHYLAAIARGSERLLDVGRVRYRSADGAERARWFVNVLSAGMGGLVDRHVARSPRAFGARAAYLLAGFRALAACERGTLRCEIVLGSSRQRVALEAYVIAICNGRYFGGGMQVAPMATLDDGRFNVITMNAPSKLAFAAESRRIYSGGHLLAAGVHHFECERISIELENERARGVFLLDLDGEEGGGLPIDIEVVPRALRLRA